MCVCELYIILSNVNLRSNFSRIHWLYESALLKQLKIQSLVVWTMLFNMILLFSLLTYGHFHSKQNKIFISSLENYGSSKHRYRLGFSRALLNVDYKTCCPVKFSTKNIIRKVALSNHLIYRTINRNIHPRKSAMWKHISAKTSWMHIILSWHNLFFYVFDDWWLVLWLHFQDRYCQMSLFRCNFREIYVYFAQNVGIMWCTGIRNKNTNFVSIWIFRANKTKSIFFFKIFQV